MSDLSKIDTENIPQVWLDEIQRVSQYMSFLATRAFEVEDDHLCDLCDVASSVLGKVIDKIDPERIYDIEGEEFHNWLGSVIPLYKESKDDDEE